MQGELAERWSVSEDGLTHEFVLRTDAVFASGRPVTADDVVFSLHRAVRLNKSPAFILGQFGFAPDNVEHRIAADGQRTVLLRMADRQAPSFVLACLTANVASVVERDLVLSHAVDGDLGNAWLRQQQRGLGSMDAPELACERSRGAGPQPPASRVRCNQPGVHPSRRGTGRTIAAAAARRCRYCPQPQLRPATGVAAQACVQVARERSILMFMGLNQSYPPLAKPAVREAIKWAVDYEGIQRGLVPQTWKVHQSFLPDGMPGVLTGSKYVSGCRPCSCVAGRGRAAGRVRPRHRSPGHFALRRGGAGGAGQLWPKRVSG